MSLVGIQPDSFIPDPSLSAKVSFLEVIGTTLLKNLETGHEQKILTILMPNLIPILMHKVSKEIQMRSVTNTMNVFE